MSNYIRPSFGFYSSLGEMLDDEFIKETEEIVVGTGRGDVAQLVSVTDVGKTTLILNTCLRMAAGQVSLPIAPDIPTPRRVLYVDCEATSGKLRHYILKMRPIFSNKNWGLIRENFIPFSDPIVEGEQLCLTDEIHLESFTSYAKHARPDLIVIDTMSAAFELRDENSNAEVRRAIMRPLKELALKTNSAVLFCHHSGKPSESGNVELYYSGRGASTFGTLSRSVFTLTKNKLKGPDYVTLQCPKAKGEKFDPVLLKLNRDKAWFEVCDEKPVVDQDLTAQDVAESVATKPEVRRAEIIDHFKSRTSEKTISRRIDDALKSGMIFRVRKGYYSTRTPTGAVS